MLNSRPGVAATLVPNAKNVFSGFARPSELEKPLQYGSLFHRAIEVPSSERNCRLRRSGQPGLVTARDITRTLAYLCLIDDEKACEALESLRIRNFTFDENIGVRMLFENLLQEPLKQTDSDVFIVIDGIDEGDWRTSIQPIIHLDLNWKLSSRI